MEGRNATTLAAQSEAVLIGLITSIEPLGCLLADGSIAACPTDFESDMAGFPPRVNKVHFAVRKVLKGEVSRSIEFLVVVPEFLVSCKGPGLQLYTHSLTFLHSDGKNLVAWGGDYAIYQRTRPDYGAVVKRVSAALRSGDVGTSSAQGER